MEDEYIAVFLILASMSFYLINKRRRRYAVRPVNRYRKEKGIYENLLALMLVKKDTDLFFKYCRMTPRLFFHLLSLVEHKLTKDPRKHPIPAAHRLILTLHYLSSGSSMQEIAFGHFLGLTTVSVIIKETTRVLWEILQPIVLMPPTEQEWNSIADEFLSKWNMPNCVGAIDGKHVNIQAPHNAGSEFFNYKKAHSIVLMASCDASYKFTLVDIGAAGRCHDSIVFSESAFGHSILNNTMNIPQPKLLPHTNIEFPHFFVADAAFPLHKHIMKPYPDNNLTEEKRIFNYRLSRARRTIENTFGIFAQRWRILRTNIIADYNVCRSIVMACVVLHNFILENESTMDNVEKKYCSNANVDVELPSHNLKPGTWRHENKHLTSVKRVGSNNSARNIMENRNKLAQYFITPGGSVPWQQEHILTGSVPPNFTVEL